MRGVLYSVMPAKAGIQDVSLNRDHVQELDARLRGHDEMRDCPVTIPSLDCERIGSYTACVGVCVVPTHRGKTCLGVWLFETVRERKRLTQ